MRFEQTRTILHHLAPEYHRTVSRYFQALADGEIEPRARLMLDYLIDHEEHRALALGEFCREASPHVLDHWFKGLESNFPEAREDLLDEAAKSDLDQLVKAAVGYKRTLIDYFADLIEHCTNAETLNLFRSLKDQEEKAMKRMIRHAQGLADL
ncbi:aminoglycoside phosphotransferase [Trichloromonas sp.]|uniref:aminoglycoside phosphotransferase n=1 Tax=Trichloromonas sp. TaxID=3069249 RepID=UPI003D815DA5